MAPDPLSSLLVFIALFVLGGLVRAAKSASLLVDASDLKDKDSPRAKHALSLIAASENRFSNTDIVFCLLLLGACACGYNWMGRALTHWLSTFIFSVPLQRMFTAIGICIPVGILYTSLAGLLPSYVAAHTPETVLKHTISPAWLILSIFKPLTAAAKGLALLLLKPFHIRPMPSIERVTEQEIRMMVDIGEEKGEIEADEKQMIENIFEFNNTTAEGCMVHRKDVTCIDIEDEPSDILKTIQESGLSRFPVYEEDIDNVIGILTSRDYLLNECFKTGKNLRQLMRPAYFVPETLRADVLFSEMQKRKQHMAVVVDEYGGTSGLVTLEDLVEEIVGNIYDEFDPQVHEDIIPIGENRWRVNGSTELDVLDDALGIKLDTGDEYDTLGGLVFSHLTEIPSDGEHPEVECSGLRIRVEQILERRVEWAIVEKLSSEEKKNIRQADLAK